MSVVPGAPCPPGLVEPAGCAQLQNLLSPREPAEFCFDPVFENLIESCPRLCGVCIAAPTAAPTPAPSLAPTLPAPTNAPSPSPSHTPTESPTAEPTHTPTESPTAEPTHAPTVQPTSSPTVLQGIGARSPCMLSGDPHVVDFFGHKFDLHPKGLYTVLKNARTNVQVTIDQCIYVPIGVVGWRAQHIQQLGRHEAHRFGVSSVGCITEVAIKVYITHLLFTCLPTCLPACLLVGFHARSSAIEASTIAGE